MGSLAEKLVPPYYAAVVNAKHGDVDPQGADVMERMITLAPSQWGFLGLETARLADGTAAVVSYWQTPAAVEAWKAQTARRVRAESLGVTLNDVCGVTISRIGKRLFRGALFGRDATHAPVAVAQAEELRPKVPAALAWGYAVMAAITAGGRDGLL